ncbi:MAG: bifunctional ornithine acetyltransferase/N-acetylglutamate synthase [Thermoleophilaceae bacterium]
MKTALYGGDPNFGRVLQAVGQALAGRDGSGGDLRVDLEVQGRRVVSDGVAVKLDAESFGDLERAVLEPEVEYAIALPGEGGSTEVFFSDLSHEYVTLNAEYTT